MDEKPVCGVLLENLLLHFSEGKQPHPALEPRAALESWLLFLGDLGDLAGLYCPA